MRANTETSRPDYNAALQIVKAVCETIREAGSIPSGTLYAALMTQGCTLQQYEYLTDTIKRAGVVREENHVLIWNV